MFKNLKIGVRLGLGFGWGLLLLAIIASLASKASFCATRSARGTAPH